MIKKFDTNAANALQKTVDAAINSHDSLRMRNVLRTIVENLNSKTISSRDAVVLCNYELLNSVLFSSVKHDRVDKKDIVCDGKYGIAGAATGLLAKSVEKAQEYITSNTPFILALPETNQEHLGIIEKAQGLITYNGGLASHGAIITKQKGKPAVIGCGEINLQDGEEITIDGLRGLIVKGKKEIIPPDIDNADMAKMLDVADSLTSDKAHHIAVKANADDPQAAKKARALGAKGIGVVRTEHMFQKERLSLFQKMFLVDDEQRRNQCLQELEKIQKEDFKGILREMDGLPVTIRLLDAPMHEFFPDFSAEKVAGFASELGVSTEVITQKLAELEEKTPMMGLRAIRLAIKYPEIYEMQVRAILSAAAELQQDGKNPVTEIMIPLVSAEGEMIFAKELVEKIAGEVEAEYNCTIPYKLGMMTETPRSCLIADSFAKIVKFFSFGTNDLTSFIINIDREKEPKKLLDYIEKSPTKSNPFQTIDDAVAMFIEMGVKNGKKSNPDLHSCVCGEQGGDPKSIHIFQKIGIDSVSVSTPSIPIARLVTAQAMIQHEQELQHPLHTMVNYYQNSRALNK